MRTGEQTNEQPDIATAAADLRAETRAGFADVCREIADLRDDVVGAIHRTTVLMMLFNAALAAAVVAAARLLW